MFDGGLLNRPEFMMSGILSTSGHVEITLFASPSCIVLVGELKYQFKEQDSSDILAQMLCEADGIRSSEALTYSQELTMQITKLDLEPHQFIVCLPIIGSGDFTLLILKHIQLLYDIHQDL